jgi:regulator of protease activity HflC (stomatin/prohibitin superfamily)
MEAFDFINDIVRWFGRFIPRWALCDPTEGGVKFSGLGKNRISLLVPGSIYWWWPIVTNVYTIETKRQTLTVTQRLTTKDDITVMVTTVIVYTVGDVIKALVETRDFEDTIMEIGEKLVVKPIMSREFDDIRKDLAESNDLNNEVKRNARSILSDYGVAVEDGYVSNFVTTEVFSHDGDGMVFGGGPEDE